MFCTHRPRHSAGFFGLDTPATESSKRCTQRAIAQRFRQISNLASVPEARREEHFLLRHVDPAVRSARLGAELKIEDEKVAKAMKDVKSRLVRLRDALADLQATEGTSSRSPSPAFRGGAHSIRIAAGR